jgi:hypothetical protein
MGIRHHLVGWVFAPFGIDELLQSRSQALNLDRRVKCQLNRYVSGLSA